MKILVGSRAAKTWYPDFREPDDWDYFSTEKIDGAETFWHPNILKVSKEFIVGGVDEEYIARPEFLYTLKVSHSFWALRNGTWPKHMYDIRWYQENTNVQFNQDIYDLFYPIWEERYGKKKAKLNVSAEDFFNKNVERTYDHDSIHDSIAYYDRPLFTKILREGSEVAVDRQKFESLSHEDKLRLVREECYATALERQVIPSGYTASPRRSYSWALGKLITSFSKGWFPLWIVLNYKELYKPDVDYVGLHLKNKDRLILL